MKEIEILKKPITWVILALGVVLAAIFQLPDQKLHLVFCDVGQGDAILATYQNTQILIDGGPDNRVLECLSRHLPFWDKTIEAVLLTHPQADHMAGLIEVMNRYEVKQIFVEAIINNSATFWEFRRVALNEGAPIHSPKVGEQIKIEPLSLAILWPPLIGDSRVWENKETLAESVLGAATYSGDINDTSVVLRLSFAGFDALLSGDIGFDVEKKIDLAAGSIEVLKISHHGSKYASSQMFLESINPKLAVISVGKNSFGHPTAEVLERLSRLGIEILRTDGAGEIEIVSDGQNYWQK